MAEELKLELPYDHEELPELLAKIKTDTQLIALINQNSLSQQQVNVLIADYINTHGLGGSGLSDEQTEKLAKIITNGTGDKFLANDGTYKTVQGGTGTSIDDTTTTATDKTWSASKIKSEIASAIGTAIGGDY